MEKTLFREFGLIGSFFRWVDEHPRISNAMLMAMAAAMAWAVWNYRFTTYG